MDGRHWLSMVGGSLCSTNNKTRWAEFLRITGIACPVMVRYGRNFL